MQAELCFSGKEDHLRFARTVLQRFKEVKGDFSAALKRKRAISVNILYNHKRRTAIVTYQGHSSRHKEAFRCIGAGGIMCNLANYGF